MSYSKSLNAITFELKLLSYERVAYPKIQCSRTKIY